MIMLKPLKLNLKSIGTCCGLFAALFFVYFILGLSGYGTDNDTYLMVRTGRKIILESIYEYSRPPSYFLPELIIGGTSLFGGHILSNLISAILGIASLYLFFCLIKKQFGFSRALIITAIIGLNPLYVIASSSSMDYIYSVFFCIIGVTALNKKIYSLAAVAFAFSISSRLSNSLIVGCCYVYFMYEAYRCQGRGAVRRIVVSGCLSCFLCLLLFVPAFVSAGYSFGFMTYFIGDWGWFEHVTRFIYKNIYLFGIVSSCLLAFGVFRRFGDANRTPLSHPVFLACCATIIVHELLFLKIPLEPSYLIPLLFLIIPCFVYYANPNLTLLALLVIATLINGFLADFDILDRHYNKENTEAIGANVGLYVRPGIINADRVQRKSAQEKFFKAYQIYPDH